MNEKTTNEETPEIKPLPKRTRKAKSATPRTRKPKPQAILDIEQEAKAKKDQYRMAQRSGGILVRILKLVPRMTGADQTKLSDDLATTITPKLI